MIKYIFFLKVFVTSISGQNLTTEQLFSRYLVTGDSKIEEIIANDEKSVYSLFCKARTEKIIPNKKDLLSEFIRRSPALGLADALIERGYCYEYLEMYDSSLIDLNAAALMVPNNKFVYYFRGIVFKKIDSSKAAIADLTTSITLDNVFYPAYQVRGNIFLEDSNYVQAIDDFSKVVSINKTYDIAYLTRGIAYLRVGEFKKAIQDLDHVKKTMPKYKNKAEELIQKAKNKQRW